MKEVTAMTTLFNNDWLFTKQPLATSVADAPGFAWSPVDIPHDWLIWQTDSLYESSNGFYKKAFTLTPELALCPGPDRENEAPASTGPGPRLYLRFEGVYQDSSIYINSRLAYEWKYGYSTFEFEITGFVHPGENEIIVLVRHQAPNSRWYSGAGIYRPVYLITRASTHFTPDGIYFSAAKNGGKWTYAVTAEITGDPAGTSEKHTLLANGKAPGATIPLADDEKTGATIPLADGEEPADWDIENPATYTLKSELFKDGHVVDTVYNTVGFRTVELSPANGFILNGRKIKLKGVCLHHDLGALGAAFNKTAARRQLLKMKEMNANAIRTSHNMPAKAIMELCDELGLLVVSEAFDMWQLSKTEYDYARYFDAWAERDVASWVRRDRNHPSLIMWSIGNEILDTHIKFPDSLNVTKLLHASILKHDPRRNGHPTIGSNFVFWENAQKCTDVLKISGYNYGEHAYAEHHEKFPDWFIYGSETAARVQSRGIYHFPAAAAVATYEDMQNSSLENARQGASDRTPQYNLKIERDTPFSGGQFIWTGSDYLGEPSPYSTKNAYFGQIDTAGFEKDAFYLYQTMWDDESRPCLHLFPYWDWNEGQIIDVFAYTNLTRAELFLNGVSQGFDEIDVSSGERLNCHWRVPYQKGSLKAVGYDKDGNAVIEAIQASFSDGKKIVAVPDKKTLQADGEDLCFLSIKTIDENGVFVANAKNRMTVKVRGAGRLVGLDNGDSTDYDAFKGSAKKLFSGRLLAIIAAKTQAGKIEAEISSPGFPTEIIALSAEPADVKPGISCRDENFVSPENNEIPVRKIELKVDHLAVPGKECPPEPNPRSFLNQDKPSAAITAVCYPLDCDSPILEWKAVTSDGIETNIAKVEITSPEHGHLPWPLQNEHGGPAMKGRPASHNATVTAIGDGEFRLRCTCKNNTAFTEIISDLEFTVSGLGPAKLNPFKLIPAALYSRANVAIDNDLEGGVKANTEMTYLCFDHVDFGTASASKITIPIIH
jgi:beta-galactosidase